MKRKFNPDRILALRLVLNLTQSEFAQRVGLRSIKKQHVSGWELSKHIPDTESLLAIANAFGIKMEYFFTEEAQ